MPAATPETSLHNRGGAIEKFFTYFMDMLGEKRTERCRMSRPYGAAFFTLAAPH
jgi:hypothetical protein